MVEPRFDLLVRGGILVDGTGTARRRVDVGVRRGRIADIGRLDRASASQVIDADGMIVAPGIVDAHTHYDPQLTWDPLASMSSYHGVTTVLAGNCGFSIAPTRASDREFVQALFAKVEQMHPDAMAGIRWDFESFGDFLDARQGKLAVNMACYIGHSNVRRWVMGEAGSERAATDDEVAAMCDVVRDAMRAGAAGLSSSHAPTHLDGDDRPVPSRAATTDELLALAAAAGSAGPGSITYLPASAIGGHRRRRRGAADPHRAGERPPHDHPGPGWPQQGRRTDGHVGAGEEVPRPRDRGGRTRVLDPHRAPARSPAAHRRDVLPLPVGAVVEPHPAAAP